MSYVIVEIGSDILFDNNRDIELGNTITVPVVVKSEVYKSPEQSLLIALDTLESIQDISSDGDLNYHDKVTCTREALDEYTSKITE